MSDANKALAEVRGWLCDNLSSGDAGKVCGMLSVVSRRISELEDENDKLRGQVTRLQSDWEGERDYADQMEAKEKMAVAENTKLRELAKAAWILFLKHGAVGPYELPEVDRVRESLNELGINVSWEELGIEVE